MFSVGIINQIQHIGRKAKAVSKLFDKYANVDYPQIIRQRTAQINKDSVRKGNCQRHRPDPFLQSSCRGGDTSQYSAQCQTDRTDRPVHQSDFSRRKPQAIHFAGIDQERRYQFSQLGFRETVQQHKQNRDKGLFLFEKRGESREKLF